MRKLRYPFLSYLSIFCLLATSQLLMAQTSQVTFGKNRVQHHRDFDEWMEYESDNFITYWYGEARNIGQSVVQMAEYDFAYIQSILEHRMNEKIQIITYVDLTDLKQSNIGNDEAFTNVAGQTKIAGNKIFVYFNGDHNDLRRQIREGIASVYLEAMLFGANLQEIVQNAVLLNLPDWFKEGLVGYIGEEWNTQQDDQLRQLLSSGLYPGFEEMAVDYPKLVGHAFWYYIAELYGKPTVSNLLYLTRINRSVESGFLYVLGTPYQITLNDWQGYFEKRYAIDSQNRNAPEGQEVVIKNKKELPLTQLKISPDGQRVVYVINEIGRYKVFMQDVQTGEREMIFKSGFRNAIQATDYNYPILAWNPSGQELAILYENRDRPRLLRYNLLEKKEITEELSTEYHRVYSVEYVNPSTMVFSAAVRGFSDIFLYYPATRQSQRITTDFWDDLDAVPVKVRDRTGILFASNRATTSLEAKGLDTILPITTFDLFYYDLTNRPGELVRVTDTPLANERQPIGIDTTYFAYLSDRSGFYNREVGYLEDYIDHYEQRIELEDGTEIVLHADSSLTMLDTTLIDTIVVYPIVKERAVVAASTNYDKNIFYQNVALRTGRVLEYFPSPGTAPGTILLRQLDAATTPAVNNTIFQNDRKVVLAKQEMTLVPSGLVDTQLVEDLPPSEQELNIETLPPPEEFIPELPPAPAAVDSTEIIDIDNYLFQSEFSEQETFAEPKPETGTAPVNPASSLEDINNFDPIPQKAATVRDKTNSDVYRFRPGRITPYRTTFRTDFVTFNMDNGLLFEGLDSYAANPDGFNTQPLSLLLKANFKDLFEDYVVEGGVRLPTSFNGTEYFLTMQSRKRRLDHYYAIYRRNQRFSEEGESFVPWRKENNVVLGQYGVRFPLDIFQSLRATSTIRRDRVQYLATDQTALEDAPAPDRTQRIGLRLEYVFDNTLDLALNLRQGTRMKFYTEYYKSFSATLDPKFEFDVARGFMGVAGVDARHYLKIDKRSILAFRLAGAVSFGRDKVLYYLGGTDNWLLPSFNNNIPTPSDPAGFVTLANNLRGFDINIRNGNAYVLTNAELRVPVFRYFSERIRSPFFRNFQAVAFFDAGTAWSGPDPYSDENPLNTTTFPENPTVFSPVTARVVYFRDPLVFSYGVGARMLLFGYLIRVDYAWGLETRLVQDPKLHISLGLDF
ncbi:MAG: hypothetical protein ACRBG0_19015 [Lewinella sp.]|jgi:hypothetical protein|uniref:hypothetical protein n=1 Tax=Lewinella sp. TaxID=2004506 RepID=UPI003D6A90E4